MEEGKSVYNINSGGGGGGGGGSSLQGHKDREDGAWRTDYEKNTIQCNLKNIFKLI